MSSLDNLAKKAALQPEQVRALFEHLITMLESGEEIRIQGFGSFKAKETKARVMNSPVLPGGKSKVPAKRQVRFKMSPELRKKWVL